ncbi:MULTISPECIES: hypothetical protein [unclassified Rhizobacter]|uniref:hypothetical protein n=1 Tax=unclassified Rhizobacter TaxID=2640088 RepID=UPI0006F30F52|nr:MULTISPECIES: hypothetical protein [unclassified Rhizobacter]KQU80602.1 hypothetical protein ASC88_13545 [Rhizobacter sp. Root29]KQW09715.1 hypothetical protein ASC98_23755 [Rhizobacter sp. Root1238]KRB14743.1 hypothetical protein ASE08_10025 [Rhizobacter sp. Root16D2]
MGLPQLLLALIFLCSYGMALGGMLGATGRWRAAGVAASSAIGFGFLTDPWEHAVMMVAFAVIGFGLFLALAWLLARAPEWFLRGEPVETPMASRENLADVGIEADVPVRTPVPATPHRPGFGL